jgi:hypothetical protein
MKTIRRWIKNLAWLFNHPATSMQTTTAPQPCDYCGKDENTWRYNDILTICYHCMKKAFDKALIPKRKSR